MILHLVHNSIFLDQIIDRFENVNPNNNKYLLDSPKDEKILSKRVEKIISAPPLSKKYFQLLGDFSQYDFVVIHFLNDCKVRIVNSAPSNVKFLWIMWGADFYSVYPLNKFLLGQETQKILFKIPFPVVIHEYITYFERTSRFLSYINFTGLIRGTRIPFRDRVKAIRRINYYAPLIPNEIHLLHFIVPHPQNIVKFSYFELKGLNEYGILGDNILIGNSGGITNNHMEIFKKIKTLNFESRKIIVPLSYGNRHYINEINKTGMDLFPDNWNPLKEFYSKEKYEEILSSCGIVIMNHYRQQGLGNIITALWYGAKVYLNNFVTTYVYFKSLGLIIFSIQEDLNQNNHNVFVPLSQKEIHHNRNILIKEYGEDNILRETKIIVETLLKK
ncbi:MAG: TDP-N-acetylfucosamine:lipid II N-acetylfucosaminyltransferase [Bacteroidales bacterium]|jgi:hypothetical protein|nr:TDP-N-acetylfucosamine:lipid II N-acetylfucosaminyltransferase [Bacteroidales bacterium]